MLQNNILKNCYRQSRRGVSRQYSNSLHRKHFYTQKLLHRASFHTENPLYTQRSFYRQALLHTDTFTHRRFYTQGTFTHRHFYTQALLNTDSFTHRRFYIQTALVACYYCLDAKVTSCKMTTSPEFDLELAT